jgi:DNA-binding NarL/FixJ family response regulator
LRVLVIDEHPGVGRGLKALLEAMPGVEVVGVADCPARGLWQAVRTPPDVALVDAELPGLCGSAVIRLLRARSPETRVVALGIYPDRAATARAAGAHAFLLKDAGYEALQRAVLGGSQSVHSLDVTASQPSPSLSPEPTGAPVGGAPASGAPASGASMSGVFRPADLPSGAVAEEVPSR